MNTYSPVKGGFVLEAMMLVPGLLRGNPRRRKERGKAFIVLRDSFRALLGFSCGIGEREREFSSSSSKSSFSNNNSFDQLEDIREHHHVCSNTTLHNIDRSIERESSEKTLWRCRRRQEGSLLVVGKERRRPGKRKKQPSIKRFLLLQKNSFWTTTTTVIMKRRNQKQAQKKKR